MYLTFPITQSITQVTRSGNQNQCTVCVIGLVDICDQYCTKPVSSILNLEGAWWGESNVGTDCRWAQCVTGNGNHKSLVCIGNTSDLPIVVHSKTASVCNDYLITQSFSTSCMNIWIDLCQIIHRITGHGIHRQGGKQDAHPERANEKSMCWDGAPELVPTLFVVAKRDRCGGKWESVRIIQVFKYQ